MSTLEDDGRNGQGFGLEVRASRLQQGLTLAELSAACGVSRAMLSKVERGEKKPTLPVASRIAHGLGVGLSELMGARFETGSFVVIHGGDQPAFRDNQLGFTREILAPAKNGVGIEVVRHRLDPGGGSGELPPYPRGTRKLVIMEAGRLRLEAGASAAELATGDAASFDADVVHSFTNVSPTPCHYLLVVSHWSARSL